VKGRPEIEISRVVLSELNPELSPGKKALIDYSAMNTWNECFTFNVLVAGAAE
jgi:hypothetical protein